MTTKRYVHNLKIIRNNTFVLSQHENTLRKVLFTIVTNSYCDASVRYSLVGDTERSGTSLFITFRLADSRRRTVGNAALASHVSWLCIAGNVALHPRSSWQHCIVQLLCSYHVLALYPFYYIIRLTFSLLYTLPMQCS